MNSEAGPKSEFHSSQQSSVSTVSLTGKDSKGRLFIRNIQYIYIICNI